jgi:hypothetical protein
MKNDVYRNSKSLAQIIRLMDAYAINKGMAFNQAIPASFFAKICYFFGMGDFY